MNTMPGSIHSGGTSGTAPQRSLRKMVKNARWAMEKRDRSGKRPSNQGNLPQQGSSGCVSSSEFSSDESLPVLPAIYSEERPAGRTAARRSSTGQHVPLSYFGGTPQLLHAPPPQPISIAPGKRGLTRRQSTGTYMPQAVQAPNLLQSTRSLSPPPPQRENITLSLSARWNTEALPPAAPSVRMPPRRTNSGNDCAPPQPRLPARVGSLEGPPPQPRLPPRTGSSFESSGGSKHQSRNAHAMSLPTEAVFRARSPSPTPVHHFIQQENCDSFNSSISSMTLTDASPGGTVEPVSLEDDTVDEETTENNSLTGGHDSSYPSIMSDLSSSVNDLGQWSSAMGGPALMMA